MKYELSGIFPTPVYSIRRESNLIPEEEGDIAKIIEGGMRKNSGNFSSVNSYIFNDNLKSIEHFCKQQLETYVEEVICPTEELEFFITQSWLNVTNPGGFHHTHYHPNSIISGVFYIATEENDNITFGDPSPKVREWFSCDKKKINIWNSIDCGFPVHNNELFLFPSSLNHRVEANKKATKDRISLSFNTFIKGTLGQRKDLTELFLK
jgi:uncharacterized protein (TIGR02466 family)